MKTNKHIVDILDENLLESLSEIQRSEIHSHCADCEACRQSLQAAKVSAILLKTSAAFETVEPTAFFQTKVMTALREKQAKSVAAFWRWWQAASPVVSLMLVVIAILTGLTLLAPNSQTVAQEQTVEFNNFSAETVILNQDLNAELTSGQALQVIYERQDAK